MDKKETPYYFSVIDRKTKKIICTGLAVQWKYINGYKFVSTDGIYFFKESYNNKIVGGGDKFQIVKDLTDQITVLEKLPDHYNAVPWNSRWKDPNINNRNCDVGAIKNFDSLLIDVSSIDVYVEVPIDKECIPLINALNSIPDIVTTTSCCGHGKRYFSIFFYVYSLDAIIKLCDSVTNKNIRIIVAINVLKNEGKIVFPHKLLFMLCIDNIKGPEAYKIADEYAREILKKYN